MCRLDPFKLNFIVKMEKNQGANVSVNEQAQAMSVSKGGFTESQFASPCSGTLAHAGQKRKKQNTPSIRKPEDDSREQLAVMEDEIEKLQEENDHLRRVVEEMDSLIHEAKDMVMQATQAMHWPHPGEMCLNVISFV